MFANKLAPATHPPHPPCVSHACLFVRCAPAWSVQDWSLNLPEGMEMEAMDTIYEQGYKDALSWCSQNGYA